MPLNAGPTPPVFRQRVVGGEGKDLLTSDGKLVLRRGGASSTVDLDVANPSGDRWDLVGQGDFVIPDDIPGLAALEFGGADEVSGKVESAEVRDFTVTIAWLDDAGNVMYEEGAGFGIDDTGLLKFTTQIRSDRARITVSDSSGAGENRVRGSINVH